VWLFESDALAGGHAARPPAVPGPWPGAPAPPSRPPPQAAPRRPRSRPGRGPL